MTLKEIAAKAGVSISTVSRIINSPDNSFARKEVRDRVWAVVKETGYIPNQSARELKTGCSLGQHTASGSLVCIFDHTKTLDDHPFIVQLGRIIEQQALERKYPIRLSYYFFDIKPTERLEKIKAVKADGAIVIGSFNAAAYEFIERHYKNVVYIGRMHISASWDQVICDGYEAAQIALEHLVSFGHRRIGYIGETTDALWYRAYLDILKKYDLTYDKRLVVNSPQNSIGGYEGADTLIKSNVTLPTAIFFAADISAIAALRRFREAKVKVPKDVSIVSMDNIEMSSYVSPMLTTIDMPLFEIGSTAVQTLIGRIQKQHRLPQKIYLPSKLIIRESVLNLNEGMYI